MPIPPIPANHIQPKSLSDTSLPHPILKILSKTNEIHSASLPPIVPTTTDSILKAPPTAVTDKDSQVNSNVKKQISIKINNKSIDTSKKVRPWIWAPFSSSARTDGLLLHHWVRAGVEYPDYPYARFDVHLDKLSYNESDAGHEGNIGMNENDSGACGIKNMKSVANTSRSSSSIGDAIATDDKKINEEDMYKTYLNDDNWTQSETDALLNLCHIHELRWPVIMDRWISQFGPLSGKKIEDLQHRYYTIGMILNRRKVEKAAQIEAENLAKALAATRSGPNNNATGSSGGQKASGGAMKSNVTGSLTSSVQDSISKDKLAAQHALAHSIATSSSTAISSVVGDVKASMQPPIPSINTGTSNQPIFNLQSEHRRRKILEMIWSRSKEDELEEVELVKELKAIEAQIRKLKKSGGHILAAAAASSSSATSANTSSSLPISAKNIAGGATPASSRGTSPVPQFGATVKGKDATDSSYSMLHAQFSSTAPTPTPGTPYLQSGRLVQPATGGHLSINKTTLKRMEQVLKELNIMERPIPTKRVCDMYDHVRKGILTLLTLQKVMLKKESEVVSRRVKLEKIAGSTVAREVANKNAIGVVNAVTSANLASGTSTNILSMKGKGRSTGSGGSGVAIVNKSSGGGSKKVSAGKGKGSKKKGGDGSKTGTKRKTSSKKATATAGVITNNPGVLNSGGVALVGSGPVTPTTAMVTGTSMGAPGVVAKTVQTHSSSKTACKAADTLDTSGKQIKKRARKS